MMARRIPNPNSQRTGHENISKTVHSHPVGNAFAFAVWLFAEDAAIQKSSVGLEIVNMNISFLAIVYVQALSIWRKRKAVGLRKFLSQQRDLTFCIEAKYSLEI